MTLLFVLVVALVNCFLFGNAANTVDRSAWMSKESTPQARAAALISAMTVTEKLVMLHGSNNDQNGDVIYVGWVPGNERLGIPELRSPPFYDKNLSVKVHIFIYI